MKTALNYLGQLRIYSLVDLGLLLLATGAMGLSFLGAALLHIGFLGYLEYSHKRPHHMPVPIGFVLAVWLAGLFLFARAEGIVFILLSAIYAKKKSWGLGLTSPLIRGFQMLVMIGAICGYDCLLAWLSAALIFCRNLLGDLRDSEDDAQEGKTTWAVRLNLKSRPFAHLLATFATTTVWWIYTGLPMYVLTGCLAIETLTYWLTPRSSNKKAVQKLRKIFRI